MLTNQRFRRAYTWLLGSVALAVWLAACGDSSAGGEDAAGSGSGATSGWTFVPPGAGTTSSNGGKTGTSGSSQGGQTGQSGSPGAGNGGMPSKPVTFACGHQVPNQPIITSFDGYEADRWQSPGNLSGGGYVYPAALELAPGDFLGTEGEIADYSGLGAWFSDCIDASKFKGVRFTVSGSVGATNKVHFFLITNRTKEVNEADGVGECVPADPSDAWGSCRPPTVSLSVTASPVTQSIPWTAFVGGLPDDKTDGSDIIALQWSFDWDEASSYTAQLVIDDLTFYSDEVLEPGGTGGAGGAGGAPSGQAGAPPTEAQGGSGG